MGFSLGHLLIILIIVLVLFGAGKLPQMMSDMGKGMKAFKDGVKDEKKETPKLKSIIKASPSSKKAPVKTKTKKKSATPKTEVVLEPKPKAIVVKKVQKSVAKKTPKAKKA